MNDAINSRTYSGDDDDLNNRTENYNFEQDKNTITDSLLDDIGAENNLFGAGEQHISRIHYRKDDKQVRMSVPVPELSKLPSVQKDAHPFK